MRSIFASSGPEPRFTLPIDPSRPATVRSAQRALGLEPCFGTDQRFECRKDGCTWRAQCMKLKAAWLR
jgi:hypothetical protein